MRTDVIGGVERIVDPVHGHRAEPRWSDLTDFIVAQLVGNADEEARDIYYKVHNGSFLKLKTHTSP
ncbi:hypothetical protein D3C84_400630 [compost metagenome]